MGQQCALMTDGVLKECGGGEELNLVELGES
jgi:hypothetical protein